MLFYCLKCRKNTEKNPKGCKFKNDMFAVAKKLRVITEQEARGLLTCLGIKAPLSKIPLVGPLLFYRRR